MSWTKQQFVDQAFAEIGFAPYVFDLQPEQREMALRKLDMMMASWNAKGIRLGYPLPSSPEESLLSTETTVPDSANEAIYMNLALRIAPTVGKQISQDTRIVARDCYMTLLRKSVQMIEQQITGLPAGAGTKPYRGDEFLPGPEETLDVGADGPLEFE